MTFILKNPPNLNPATQGSSLTEGKRNKRSKKTNGEGGDESVDGSMTEASQDNGGEGEDDDDGKGWTVDVSEEAVRARMQVRFFVYSHLRNKLLIYQQIKVLWNVLKYLLCMDKNLIL